MSLVKTVENIELKVRQLALKLERLERENTELLNENKELRTELSTRDEKVGELKSHLTNTQAVLERKREDDPEQTQKLRKQLDQYINEIESCIEWLQKV